MLDRTVLDPGTATSTAPETTQLLSPAEAGAGLRDVTQQAIARTCPVCATPNTPLDVFCQDCGLLFTSVSGPVEALPDPGSVPRLVDAGSGREMLLNPGQSVAGREGDLLVEHPTVSRRHAAFTLEGGRVWLEDLGSSNGTSVADRRLAAGEKVEVLDGDVARLGSVALAVRIPGGPTRPAPAAPEATAEEAVTPTAPVGWLEGPNGEPYLIHAGRNTLGRRAGNQIVIADAFMSGRHADLVCREDGSAELVDVGSTNGSFLAGQRLVLQVPVPLRDGVEFTLGRTSLRFHVGAPPAPGENTQPTEDQQVSSLFETVREPVA